MQGRLGGRLALRGLALGLHPACVGVGVGVEGEWNGRSGCGRGTFGYSSVHGERPGGGWCWCLFGGWLGWGDDLTSSEPLQRFQLPPVRGSVDHSAGVSAGAGLGADQARVRSPGVAKNQRFQVYPGSFTMLMLLVRA